MTRDDRLCTPHADPAERTEVREPASIEIRTESIPMPDGVELAATIYLPARRDAPLPVLLEYLPYRKDDAMAVRDFELYSFVATHGYCGARVDIRGTGQSGGTLPEGEYTEIEQADAQAVIAWLAAAEYCNGAVGMWGISWGGFNAIQVALRRPPGLRAILVVDASDDLFHDDVHYIDGLLHLDEYALMIDHLNGLPAGPEYLCDEESLRARFDQPPWLLRWLAEPYDGPYWRRASLAPDYDRLEIPVFAIGGWYDGYRDSIPRMLASVRAPCKALIGPWNHSFPHDGVPGPAIEWRHEALRWFDHWLKGIDTGMLEEPPVTVFARSWHPPGPEVTCAPGSFRYEDGLPPRRVQSVTLFCNDSGGLTELAPPESMRKLGYVASAGVSAGHWWGELAGDQREADAYSLTFDTPPLAEPLEILGFVEVEIHAGADALPLHFFARLCDVAPDNEVTLVTGAGRPGPSRSLGPQSDQQSPKLEILPVQLHVTSWTFPPGHRIRLSLSNALWPMIWPTPHRSTATFGFGADGTRLTLPVVPAGRVPDNVIGRPVFPDPEPGPRIATTEGQILPDDWRVERTSHGEARAFWSGSARTEHSWGEIRDDESLTYCVADSSPCSASAEGEARTEVRVGARVITLVSRLRLSSDVADLHYRFSRELLENGAVLRKRSWASTLARGPN
jgi:predicted acyl esterase